MFQLVLLYSLKSQIVPSYMYIAFFTDMIFV